MMKNSSRKPANSRGKKQKHMSLSFKVTRSVAISCALLGLLILIISITLYGAILVREFEHVARNEAKQVAVAVRHSSEYEMLSREILSIYSAHTQAERESMDAESYRALYAEIQKSRSYLQLKGMLEYHCSTTDTSGVSIAVPVPESGELVVIVKAYAKAAEGPGDRMDVPERFLRAFHSWNKEDELLQYWRTSYIGLVCTAVVPIANEQGTTVAYLFADVAMKNLAAELGNFAGTIALAILLITALITWIHARRMKHTVVEPINSIAKAARNYVADKRSGSKVSDHFADLDIHTGDEVEDLSLTMANMERELLEIEESLTAATAENQRISTELSLASRIQANSLPGTFPPFPERKEFDIYASMHPAKEVGGDFYDFFLLDEEHLALVIADVSGKGVPAALFMMISKMLIQNYALVGGSPREVLENVNNHLVRNNQMKMFVTVWFGILDLKSGRLNAVNAGHEYPAIRPPDGAFEILKDRHGLFAGIKGGITYMDYEIQLEKGSRLFVYTDGVTEATDTSGKMFGRERMLSALAEVKDGSPQEILEHVRQSIDTFAGDAPQFDDITMLCLEYRGPATPVRECEISARLESVPEAVAFAAGELERLDCPAKEVSRISIAVEEIVSNVARYAYGAGNGTISVRFEALQDSRGARISFIDHGVTFNPLEAPEPDIIPGAEARQPGGLGIFLVRRMMDEMTYEHVGGRNILRITKRF